MAQRFGGKYSPDGRDTGADKAPISDHTTSSANSYRSAKVDPVGMRANLMALPAGLVSHGGWRRRLPRAPAGCRPLAFPAPKCWRVF